MSALSETVSNKATPAAESEQVALAFRVEHARRQLMLVMLEHQMIRQFIARQLFNDLNNGFDHSEIILIKNNEHYRYCLEMFVAENSNQEACSGLSRRESNSESVQKLSLVQLYDAFRAASLVTSDLSCQLLYKFHFLPVYLIELSESVLGNPAIAGELDAAFKTKLQMCRWELKQLRQDMIADNTGLVAFVAYKFKARSLSFDDLMQEGLIGLIKAVDRFEPERGHCFSTYAVFWIRQAISRLIVKQDKAVPLPVALAEKSSPVFEAMRQCYLEKERWPSLAELQACCDLSEQDIKTISSYYQSTYIYDSDADEDDSMSVMEKMQQQQFSQPLDDLIDSDLARFVDKAVATLPEKHASILTMRFGLKNHTEMTLQAVADHLHVTRERVRQIQNEALKKLEQQFGFDLMLFLEPNDT